MRIAFFGTPQRAASVLKDLISEGIDIQGIVTAPDRPKGRGLGMAESAVGEVGKLVSSLVLKPEKIDDAFIEEFKKLQVDLAVVVAYGKILPNKLLEIPKYGFINLHPSLLPKYRGASPVQSALLNGELVTGVTIFKLNERMDAGDMIEQAEMQVSEDDNAALLSDKLFKKGTQLIIEAVRKIADNTAGYAKQEECRASYCKTIKKEDGKLDFSDDPVSVSNKVKAFYEWPVAFCTFNGKKVRIFGCEPVKGPIEEQGSSGQVLRIIKNFGPVVKCGRGEVVFTELQPESSKRMSGDQFVQGYRIKPGDNFTSF